MSLGSSSPPRRPLRVTARTLGGGSLLRWGRRNYSGTNPGFSHEMRLEEHELRQRQRPMAQDAHTPLAPRAIDPPPPGEGKGEHFPCGLNPTPAAGSPAPAAPSPRLSWPG